jgi:hypothetical protein
MCELACDTGQQATNLENPCSAFPDASQFGSVYSQPIPNVEVEDEDAEDAYFRGLKRQEEQRRRRAAREGNGL